MSTDYLSLLAILLAPPIVGGVIGAWITTGRLFAARALPGKSRLPVWIPWAIAPLIMLVGYVIAASQIIDASTRLFSGPVAQGGSALMALLLSPVWIGSAAQAVLGMVLHYVLDGGLMRLRLDDVPREGLAIGLRAAWLIVGLLTLLFGLQATYSAAQVAAVDLLETVSVRPVRLVMDAATILLVVLAMILPALIERQPVFSAPDPASPPPPPPDRPGESG